MKTNCPHCNKKLIKSKTISNCFECSSNRNNIKHIYRYFISHNKETIHFYNSNKNESIEFTFTSFIKCIQSNSYIYTKDFSIFKDKTFKEIECLYNKMVIFQ